MAQGAGAGEMGVTGDVTGDGGTTVTVGFVNGPRHWTARVAHRPLWRLGGGTGLLLIDGAANQTFTGAATPAAGALPNLQIAKSGGTLTLVGTLRTGRNWTYTSGTVDPGSSTLVMTAGILSGSQPLANFDLRGGTITAVGHTRTPEGGAILPVAAGTAP